MPGCLDDASNALVLQRRRGRKLLRKQRSVSKLLIWVHTSDGGRLRDWATKLTVLLDRLIEQNKVLLMWRQVQVL